MAVNECGETNRRLKDPGQALPTAPVDAMGALRMPDHNGEPGFTPS